jgi:methionyl-tRNA formyltransferase
MSTPSQSTERPRVVFFGSGPVAAESLELLLEWCDIEAVVTKPQPPHHKEAFPVIAVAKKHNLTMYTVSNRHELDDVIKLAHFTSRVGVLIDFGIIVSQAAIDSFELGIINSHFSILPEWRGADPITFSILSGQKQTGVSLMRLVQAMDEGPLIGYGEYDLPDTITTPALTYDLIGLSDALLQHELPRLLSGESTGTPQTITGREVSYSRKLSKDDSILDFSKPAAQLEREVRAFIEWPKSRTQVAGKDVIVTAAHVVTTESPEDSIGTIRAGVDGNTIDIVTSDGVLSIDKLKPAGKQEMTARGFLAGNKLY